MKNKITHEEILSHIQKSLEEIQCLNNAYEEGVDVDKLETVCSCRLQHGHELQNPTKQSQV